MRKAVVELLCFTLFVAASQARAEVLITSRSSLLHTSIDFGYIGSVLSTIDSQTSTTIDDASLRIEGSRTDGGPIGDVSWDATYQYQLDQQLVPDAPRGFSGSSGTGLFTFAGGDGVSYLSATNRLAVEFQNTTAADFEVVFNSTDFSQLALDRMTSSGGWELVWTVPSGIGEVSTVLPLAAGVFRLSADTVVATENGFTNGGSWAFSIAVVPEPGSLVLLAIGACGLAVKWRRRCCRSESMERRDPA